jgi:hypothetical protein
MNITKLFNDDIRAKKKIGANIHKKTGLRGYVGKMRFPSDIMSKEDKKKHIKAGRIRAYNMYEKILTRQEFNALDTKTQKAMFTVWREKYTNKQIMKGMGLSSGSQFHKYIVDLDIPLLHKAGGRRKGAGRPKKDATPAVKEVQQQAQAVQQAPQAININGLHLEYNGTYNAEQLSKIFTKLQLITDGEENEYYISVKISEKLK